jgi:hypothetical protein
MPLWSGCSHKKLSFPMTRPRKVAQGSRRKNTYAVCLDCAKEIPYSWSEMRLIKERRQADDSSHSGQQPSILQPASLGPAKTKS